MTADPPLLNSVHKWAPKAWGGEEIVVNCKEANYCLKVLHLMRGHFGSWHFHKVKDETFYVSEGAVLVSTLALDPDDVGHLSPEGILAKLRGGPGAWAHHFTHARGSSVRLRPWTLHRIYGVENSKIVEASTHSDDADTYRLAPGG